jgi:hypothetical protein
MLLHRCPSILDYVIYLPPPCANYAKFTDWFKPFITTFLAESKYGYASVYSTFNKEEMATNALNLYNGLEEKINSYLEKSNVPKDPNFLQAMFPNYLIGKTIKEDKILEEKVGENSVILLTLYETTVYYTISKPTGETNKAFPECVIKEGTFNCREIDPVSNVYKFIQFKQDDNMKTENAKMPENEMTDILPIGHDIKMEEVKETAAVMKEDVDVGDELLKKKQLGKTFHFLIAKFHRFLP